MLPQCQAPDNNKLDIVYNFKATQVLIIRGNNFRKLSSINNTIVFFIGFHSVSEDNSQSWHHAELQS